MLLIGLDDTDLPGTPGTNRLARCIADGLPAGLRCDVVLRHQLLLDPRIPYTSGNGCASIGVVAETAGAAAGAEPPGAPGSAAGTEGGSGSAAGTRIEGKSGPATKGADALLSRVLPMVRAFAPRGSDPGVCVAALERPAPPELLAFGRRCQDEPVSRSEARDLAASLGLRLEGVGGTEDGVIGALAAVALRACGDDGRVVHARGWPWPDDFSGVREVGEIRARGVDEVRDIDTGRVLAEGRVDLGKRLRPSFRGGRVVLWVEPMDGEDPAWRAVKLP